MKNNYTLLLGMAFLGISACCLDEQGIEEQEVTYETIPFDEIRLESSSNIYIVQANEYKVTVRGQKRDINDTDVEVHNGRLLVKEHGHIDEDQEITIYVPEIRYLESFGSSLVYGQTQFIQNLNMGITLTGSGEIDMYVDVDDLDLKLTGSGYVYLEGFADRSDIDIIGSGWVRSFALDNDIADIRIEGSGSAEVNVDTDLDIIITGSGDVFYKGNPQINSVITGSGQVINAN